MARTVDYWYRRKYSLTIHDPRYLNTTALERAADYWAEKYLEDPNLLNEIEDEGFSQEDILAQWEADAEDTVNIDTVDDFEEL
ncbi:hypothetical protein NAD41_000875 [Salmonella enterica]|nr:hypothetical protein [Salmonella enterica]EKK6596259.1 hypothetical protein [Salmonella enterica]